MHLTRYTDYSLRLLMILAIGEGEGKTIREVSEIYGISRNHLVKVVNRLVRLGLVETTRGRHGGVRLARPPEEVEIGRVVRAVEPSFEVAECFGGHDRCLISPACGYRGVLLEALAAFHEVLDRATLADLVDRRQRQLRALFGIETGRPAGAPPVAARGVPAPADLPSLPA